MYYQMFSKIMDIVIFIGIIYISIVIIFVFLYGIFVLTEYNKKDKNI